MHILFFLIVANHPNDECCMTAEPPVSGAASTTSTSRGGESNVTLHRDRVYVHARPDLTPSRRCPPLCPLCPPLPTSADRVYSDDPNDPNFNLCNPITYPTKDCTRGLGFATVQHLGPGGEEGKRILLGWAENVTFRSFSGSYFVQEIDESGNRYGTPLALAGVTGWGETGNSWSQFQSGPAAGCVTWPYTWGGQKGPGYEYGPSHDEHTYWSGQDYNLVDRVHVTVVCPKARTSAAPTATQMPKVPANVSATEQPPMQGIPNGSVTLAKPWASCAAALIIAAVASAALA